MIEKILEPYISERFMSDARYRKGHIRIINPLPGTSVLGLHIPDMRKVASQLAASDDAVGLIGQFEAAPERSLHYEEYMVWGMMLNRIKLPLGGVRLCLRRCQMGPSGRQDLGFHPVVSVLWPGVRSPLRPHPVHVADDGGKLAAGDIQDNGKY